MTKQIKKPSRARRTTGDPRVSPTAGKAQKSRGAKVSRPSTKTLAELKVLRKFARAVLDGYQTGVVGDIDGGWLEDYALGLGLLVDRIEQDDDPNYYLCPSLKRMKFDA